METREEEHWRRVAAKSGKINGGDEESSGSGLERPLHFGSWLKRAALARIEGRRDGDLRDVELPTVAAVTSAT